jgi:ABC-type molybdate transport system substrate-binding protein
LISLLSICRQKADKNGKSNYNTTDALASLKVKVAITLPSDSHGWIVYPAAVISASKHINIATDFLNYLKSNEGMQIFKKYGSKDTNNN